MKRLLRDTLYTENNSLEIRVQALERRIIPGPPDWAVAWFSATPQPVSSGGTILTWEHFRTTTAALSTSTIGGAANNTAGDQAIRLARGGIVLVTAYAEFENGTFYRKVVVNGGGGEVDPFSNIADIQDSAAFADDSDDTDGNPLAVSDEQWFANSADSTAGWFSAQATVGAGQPDMDAVSGSLTVVLFQSTGVLWDDTEVY